MNAPVGRIQNIATAASQENLKLKEESDMKTASHISNWINDNAPVKMVAGLALGAMLMTAIALPSNASADVPKRPLTSEQQLVVRAEIEDGAYDTGFLTPEEQLVVRAEIEDSVYETVSLTPEQQLVVRAEIEDGAYETVSLTPEQQLVVQAEIDDGVMKIVDYKRDQVGLSDTGVVGILLEVLSHDEGRYFSEEEWVQIMGELDDDLV